MGSVAALAHPTLAGVANYGELFLRDNVPVILQLLLLHRFAIVRHFLMVCLDLQSDGLATFASRRSAISLPRAARRPRA
ncbi:MAG: glycoside hydrolase 100 family protein [Cyanobium sp.]